MKSVRMSVWDFVLCCMIAANDRITAKDNGSLMEWPVQSEGAITYLCDRPSVQTAEAFMVLGTCPPVAHPHMREKPNQTNKCCIFSYSQHYCCCYEEAASDIVAWDQ